MPVDIECYVFSCETYTGKNGLGANVILLNQKEKGKLEINTSNQALIQKLAVAEGTDVIIKARVSQNKFGTRIEVLDVVS